MNLLLLSRLLATLPPSLTEQLTYDDFVKFGDIVWWLREEIAVAQPPHILTPPERLPDNVHGFLMDVFALSDSDVLELWTGLQEVVWPSEKPPVTLEQRRAHALLPLFLKHGTRHRLCTSVSFLSMVYTYLFPSLL